MRISDWSSDVCSSDLILVQFNSFRSQCNWPYLVAFFCSNSQIVFDVLVNEFFTENPWDCPSSFTYLDDLSAALVDITRSEERRVGNECVSTFRSRWSRYH